MLTKVLSLGATGREAHGCKYRDTLVTVIEGNDIVTSDNRLSCQLQSTVSGQCDHYCGVRGLDSGHLE